MIGYIKGTVEEVLEDCVIIDNNGIGYRIFTSAMVIQSLSGKQEAVKLFTYLHVREDEMSLFGFLSKEELHTFKLLLGVNGIGPKAALSILSVLTVGDLTYAVMSGDTKAITRANGVGAKGANRIIMELKDKLSIGDVFTDNTSKEEAVKNIGGNQSDSVQDTVLALVSLGYSDLEALKAIKQIPDAETMNSEELLKLALKKMF